MIRSSTILTLFIFASGFVTHGAIAQSPATAVKGLRANVSVLRDYRAVPYIQAGNDADLYFAQGYVTASDRLWQMDIMRRRARGETAEIFGNAALEDDKLWRRYGFARIAEENIQYLSPELRAALEKYAEGVNAYIDSLTAETLPSEFKILQYRPAPWRPSDSIIIGKILAEALSSTWRQDLQRAAISVLPADKRRDLTNQVTPFDVVLFGKDEAPPVNRSSASNAVSDELLRRADELMAIRERSLTPLGLFAEELAASNNWVIAGKLTADGRAMLANDPHLAPTAPGIWYLSHLTSPALRVAGVTFPGVPGVVLGHNEHFAWGATNVGPDVQDLYIETFNDAGKYKTPEGWADAKVRTEEIKVRTSITKTETTAVSLQVTETRNGPVILEEGGKRYALKWTALESKNSEFEAFFNLNRGKNWEDFKRALSSYGGATQNFVYADTSGNIGWYAAGKIPVRRVGAGELPYDGATNAGDWVGFIPFNELPNLYNPASGLIVTANQRIVGTAYKYQQVSRDAAPPWRARRIVDRLTAKPKLTMDDVRDVLYDVYNIPIHKFAQEIVRSGAATPQTTELLKNWDGMMKADSKGAVLANEIRICMANRIAESNRPAPAAAIRERILYWAVPQKEPRWLPAGFASYNDLIKACDESSRTALADPRRLGPDQSSWRWDSVFRARFMHPLAAAPLIGGQFLVEPKGVNGSGQTPNVGASVSMRHISSPGNWDATRFVIPIGQSGDSKSPHFRDQFEAWNTGEPAVFPFTKAAVEAAARSTQLLVPAR
jgi:penicillin G amidase